MKIGFFVPGREHLGVEQLSAEMKKAGHSTEFFFDPNLCTDGALASPLLAQLFNVEDMLAEEIANAELDLLCFSAVTDTYANLLRMAQKVKQLRNIPTVFGGVHCTAVPERVVRKPQVDYLVVGEGEEPLRELCTALESGNPEPDIKNVWYLRDGGEIVEGAIRAVIPELDALCFPDKGAFFEKVPGYFQHRYSIIASRGCRAACTFCNNSMYKKLYDRSGLGPWKRQRSVDIVIEELLEAKRKYPLKQVEFLDEIFFDDRDWIEEFCDKYGREIGLPFWCYGHIQFITPDLIARLEKAGCHEINVGVQTIREFTRKKYLARGGSNEMIRHAIKCVTDSRICLSVGNILALPGQSVEEGLELAAFYNENRVDLPIVSFLGYYPKTDIVKISVKLGLLTEEDVEAIEEAEEGKSMYYTSVRTKTTRDFQKIRLLILMTTWAPHKLLSLVITKGWWRALPTRGPLNLGLAWMGNLRPLWTGKQPFKDNSYTPWRYGAQMLKYGLAKLSWKLRTRSPKAKTFSQYSKPRFLDKWDK